MIASLDRKYFTVCVGTLLNLAFVPIVAAQFYVCKDTDTPTNNSQIRGTAELLDTSTTPAKSIRRATDSCNSSGTALVENKCVNNLSSSGQPLGTDQLVSETINCAYGCLDGVCIVPGNTSDGCFTRFIIKLTPSSADATKPVLSVQSITQEIGALWIRMARSASLKNGNEPLEIQVLDSNNTVISRAYSDFHPPYFHESDPTLLSSALSDVILAFNPSARSVLFKAFGTQLLVSLPIDSQRCVRKCISSALDAGIEKIDSCCSGRIKSQVNNTTFVCLPSASPSPTPSP